MKEEFLDRVRLMLRALPHVAREECFALKGGTALNFFLWDMPRLSVDIDLTYLPVEPREESLRKISQALLRIKQAVSRALPQASVHESRTGALRRQDLRRPRPTAPARPLRRQASPRRPRTDRGDQEGVFGPSTQPRPADARGHRPHPQGRASSV